MYDFLFFLFGAGAVIGALLMVTRRNPVSAVILLVAVFFSLSGLFLLLGAHYIAAINIILYAGAIMVLFLFVIMLLKLGHAIWNDMRGPLGGLVGGSIVVAFLGLLARRLFEGASIAARPASDALQTATAEHGVIGVVARPLFTEYAVVLEVTGVLLLAAMVGTIYLARKDMP